eukprot:16040-Heterococcus_DN1.PRE.2
MESFSMKLVCNSNNALQRSCQSCIAACTEQITVQALHERSRSARMNSTQCCNHFAAADAAHSPLKVLTRTAAAILL